MRPFSNESKNLAVCTLALMAALYLKATHGFDKTDEMQYYGELVGLLETGRLFSNDLFFQQTAWIPFYPILSMYHFFMGETGLILISRILLSISILAVFFWSVQSLNKTGYTRHLTHWCMFSATFAVTHHNIFAISYNTISQLVWVLFIALFLNWENRLHLSKKFLLIFPFLSMLCAFAHPTASILMGILTVIRIVYEKKWKALRFILAGYLIAMIFGLTIALSINPFEDYLSSVIFSKGYGVGSINISNFREPLLLLGILSAYLIPLKINAPKYKMVFLALFVFGVIYWIVSTLLGNIKYGVGKETTLLLSLLCSLLIAYIRSCDKSENSIVWITIILSSTTFVYSLTSGNGVSASAAIQLIALPYLLVIATKTTDEGVIAKATQLTSVAALSLMMIFLWTKYPYRDLSWYEQNVKSDDIGPMFEGLYTNQYVINEIDYVKNAFDEIDRKKLLITGRMPILYFANNVVPDTCMIYLHSLGLKESAQKLKQCLSSRSPDYLLFIKDNPQDSAYGDVVDFMRKIYVVDNSSCKSFQTESIAFSGYYRYTKKSTYTLCKTA